jgi:uncharacterized protein (DUF1697 family)
MASMYVALMRGINVGGKNMVPMKALAEEFRSAGCKDVRTYIQSGNVVFSASGAAVKKLAKKMAACIETRFGCSVPVVLRSAEELQEAIARNPYAKRPEFSNYTHLMFLADEPAAEAVRGLDPKRSAPDEFTVVGRDVYLWTPGGMGKTKLSNAYFDSKLKTVSTVRNWRTVLSLAEMMGVGV